ncbi:cell division protein FtsI/penicillin-binding protein 2 [Priestia megaterium]|nr:cell division protein FtsI/penicillin-binding protein 2 [Priestia megaterium]
MKRKREKNQIPYRVNLIFLVVFVLFSVLILRLGLIQIVYGENYSREVEKTQNATVSTPVPRGKMYDRYNRVIVDNTPLNTITYARFQGNTTEERLRIAKKLATMIDVPYTTNIIDIPENKKNVDSKNVVKITERDMKDYWITIHPKKTEQKITKTDRKKYKTVK